MHGETIEMQRPKRPHSKEPEKEQFNSNKAQIKIQMQTKEREKKDNQRSLNREDRDSFIMFEPGAKLGDLTKRREMYAHERHLIKSIQQ